MKSSRPNLEIILDFWMFEKTYSRVYAHKEGKFGGKNNSCILTLKVQLNIVAKQVGPTGGKMQQVWNTAKFDDC